MSSFSGRDRLVAFDLLFLGDKSQFTSSMEGECGRYKTQVTGHRSQVTGHRSQVTGYRAQGTGHRKRSKNS